MPKVYRSEFTLVTAGTLVDIITAVQQALDFGWDLHGEVFMDSHDNFYQALVKLSTIEQP